MVPSLELPVPAPRAEYPRGRTQHPIRQDREEAMLVPTASMGFRQGVIPPRERAFPDGAGGVSELGEGIWAAPVHGGPWSWFAEMPPNVVVADLTNLDKTRSLVRPERILLPASLCKTPRLDPAERR
jgi:hypothetical protein